MNDKINTPTKKIAFTGVFIALVFVLTIVACHPLREDILI